MLPLAQLTAKDQFLLLTDDLDAPADFLVLRMLGDHLKKGSESRCVMLSASDELARWKAIGSKMGINLSTHLSNESLRYIDALPLLQGANKDPNSPSDILHSLYSTLQYNLTQQASGAHTFVILDDLSTFEWTGISTSDLCRFVRACSSLCSKTSSTLLARIHVATPNEPDDLLRYSRELCSYHIECRALSSGRSGSVSGEIAIHIGPLTDNGHVKPVLRTQAIQYRLTDVAPVFFERGTGAGVI